MWLVQKTRAISQPIRGETWKSRSLIIRVFPRLKQFPRFNVKFLLAGDSEILNSDHDWSLGLLRLWCFEIQLKTARSRELNFLLSSFTSQQLTAKWKKLSSFFFDDRYGDKVPSAYWSKVFAIVWILIGLVLMSTLSSALTSAVSLFVVQNNLVLYGTKVYLIWFFWAI